MNADTVTELYRQIGRIFRGYGAERVILMNARTEVTGTDMELELAIDGMFDMEEIRQMCKKQWPQIGITLIDLNEADDMVLREAIEDGVLL